MGMKCENTVDLKIKLMITGSKSKHYGKKNEIGHTKITMETCGLYDEHF